jgi:hypothetical protein
MSTTARPAWLGLLLVFGILAAGCGKGDVPRFKVSGSVKYQGKSVPVGTITFQSENGQYVETAPIKDGQYSIDRAPVGTVKIGIVTPSAPPPMQMKQKVEGKSLDGGADSIVAVPGKYANPENSGLTYTVTSTPNQTHDISLK